MKNTIKTRAVELREKGYTLAEIAQSLSISKSTASLWLRAIPLDREVLAEKRRVNGSRLGAVQKGRKAERASRALVEAKRDIGSLSKRDLLMLGIALYIGEGTKWQNLVRIVNSDPKVIQLAVKWLTQACGVGINNIYVRVHGYPDTDFGLARRHWGKVAGIPSDHFQSDVVDKRIGKSSKRGSLPYGTLHVNVVGDKRVGTSLGLKIRKWMEVVLD